MARVGRKRFIEFRLADITGAPVSTKVLTDLAVLFTRDDVTCTDGLTLVNKGNGLYILEYTPSAPGHDYIDIYDATDDLRNIDAEDVDDVTTFFDITTSIALTQDFGGTGVLKPVITNPQDYTLYVFPSQVWQTGQTDPVNSLAATGLDTLGNWLTSPLSVNHGTYHIVLIGQVGDTHVIRTFLPV
jgi:hypothetical protein